MGSQRVRHDWVTELNWTDGWPWFFECWVSSQLFQSPFTFIKRLFSSFSLSTIRVVSFAYLRLLIYLPAILSPAYDSRIQPSILHYVLCIHFVAQSCPTLCDPMGHSMPGFPVYHQLLEFTQTHVHWVGDAIQPSHPLLSPSPPTINLSQHEGLFKWVSSSHEVAKVLEFQLQHQSFQWTLKTDLLWDGLVGSP